MTTAAEHVESDTCPCAPTLIPVERLDGSIGWVIAHHEPDQDPSRQAERAAAIVEAIEAVKLDTEEDL